MTPFCIFAIDAGDERCPLGNIPRLTLQPALKGCILFIHIKVYRVPWARLSDLVSSRRVPKKEGRNMVFYPGYITPSRMIWKKTTLLSPHFLLPVYDCASSSKKEVPSMGISCISQVQEPWGSLPGNGHLWPEILGAIFKYHTFVWPIMY